MDKVTLHRKIEAYYRGERISNAILFFIGGGAIIWTFLLFYWRQGHLSTGFFISTLPLGLFFVLTGGYRFYRSFKRFDRSMVAIDKKHYFFKEELPLLEERIERFHRKKGINTLAFIIGIFSSVSIAIFQLNHVFLGTSMSITIFSAILLAFDLFGQFRVEEYLHYLKKTF
ncbi:MAG: hypothetical protein V3V00_08920 [Saprospiraceae bacterium]